MNKDNASGHDKMDMENQRDKQFIYGQLGILGAGYVCFLFGEHAKWVSSAKQLALQSYIKAMVYMMSRLYLRV